MPVPRNTMILITPAIDLLLYPIASVGYLPALFWRRRRPLSSVPPQERITSFDKQLSVRKSVALSLADKLECDFASFLELAAPGSKKLAVTSDELPFLMLRSLEAVIRELAEGVEANDGEDTHKPWRALERKLQDLEKHVRAAQANRQVAALEDVRSLNTHGSSIGSPGLPAVALHHGELGFESTGGSQQCYELIAGSCAILCLESITVCIDKHRKGTAGSSSGTSSPVLPVLAKTFVFTGMQSGTVVVYDATSASAAPISFQAHVGGVLAMAVYTNIWTAGSVRAGRITRCEECSSALPEVFLVTGGSDTSLAVWDLSPLLFGGREPRLLSGTQILIDGPKVSIAPDDLLAVRLTFLPHQGDVLSLLVTGASDDDDCVPTSGCRHDLSARLCTVEACEACLPGIRVAMRLDGITGGASSDASLSPAASFLGTALHKVQSNPFVENPEGNLLLFIGFQSAKIGAIQMSDLLRYFRHTQVMVSVLANAVTFQPAQQQALPLRVSRDFELKMLASGQLRVMFSGEQERESLRSLFTRGPSTLAALPSNTSSALQQRSSTAASPCQASVLATDESFRSLLADFARNLRSVTLRATHSATVLWSAKCCRSGRPGCLYPPTGTIYCFEAPHELEVPLPEGAAASASPGTYRVVTSTSSLRIVAQPSKGNCELKIGMRFLPFEESDVKRQHSQQSLVGPWLDESGHNGFVECLISCGRKVICSGGGDGRLLLWGEEGTLVGELSGHHGGILCVAFTEAPVGSPCRDLRSSEEQGSLSGGTPQPECQSPSDDGAQCLQGLLFSGSRDNSIRVWALEQLVCIQTLNVHTSEVLALVADASRNLLISGSANGELFVWQLDLMVVAFRLSLNASPCHADNGLSSGVDPRQFFRSSFSAGQEVGVSFTDLLLVSEVSCQDNDGIGSPEGSPQASSMTRGEMQCGLQLWAGRGDGKLGVWNLSDRDIAEESSVEETEDYSGGPGLVSDAEVREDMQVESALKAVAASPPMSSPGVRGPLGAIGVRTRSLASRDALAEVQRGISTSRISGMIISPGASMPSLPPLTSGAGLEPRRSDFLPLLAQFVAYKSVSASRNPLHVSGCIGAAKFVAQLFEQSLGATVDIVWPRRSGVASEFHGDQEEDQPHPVVFGRLGANPQRPTIVFYSHYDVVSVGSVASSTTPTSADMLDAPPSPVTPAASPIPLPSTSFVSSVQPPVRHHSACEASRDAEMTKYLGARAKPPEWLGTGWNTNPWKVHCKDGYIYGRGVTDNKGPIICSLLAVKQFISEWRRKHRGRQTTQQQSAEPNNATTTQVANPTKNDPSIPFNFVWICEGDEENGSMG